MKRLCASCGRPGVPPDPGRTRCEECRERSGVRVHQLHKRRGLARRYRNHDCALCRKHRTFARELNRRWDARDVWTMKRCPKGHRWMKDRQSRTRCPVCDEKLMRLYWRGKLTMAEVLKKATALA